MWPVHVLVATMLAVIITALFLDLGSGLIQKLGRDPTLTGRTQLWAQILKMTNNTIVGTGFESFWLGARLDTLSHMYWWHPTESHNGYIETYLNLGWIGVVLLGAVLVTGYRNVIRQLKQGLPVARLWLAFIFVALAYDFTEAAFRTTDLVWIALLLSVARIQQGSLAHQPVFQEAGAILPNARTATNPARPPLRPAARARSTAQTSRRPIIPTGNLP